MLVRLLYASRARQTIDAAMLDAILATSLERNPRHGITGVLCHGNSVFLQALEGERQEVSGLFQAITRDPRHHDVVLLHFEDICQREFAGWAMGHVNAARINTATLLKFSARAELDPFSTSGQASLALLKELSAGASVVARATERGRP